MKLSLLLISLFILAINPNIKEVRENYKQAVTSKSEAVSFNDYLKKITKEDDQRLVAYKGASITLTARYLKGAKEKGISFKKGVEWVEYAIERKPLDMEVRFVRLSIQQNSPKFLGYNKEIESDKSFILTNFNTIRSKDFKAYLKSYILDSEHFSQEEKKKIE